MGYQDLTRNFTYNQLRAMYKEASKQARQSLAAVAAKYPGAEVVSIHKGDFKSFSAISKGGLNKKDLAKEVYAAQRFLNTAAGSGDLEAYEASRAATVAAFNEHGYDFVNEDNLDDVKAFMRDATERGLKSIYGSDELLEKYKYAKRKGLSAAQFAANVDRWERNAQAVAAGRMSGKLRVTGRGGSSKNFYVD